MSKQLAEKIELANKEAVRRLDASEPVLIDIVPARSVIPGLNITGQKTILHSGPPVSWEKMCGAQKGAVVALAIFEGWATTPGEANQLFKDNIIKLEPNHHHRAVGSMAGATSPSLPVWVVQNRAVGAGNYAFCGHADSRHTFGEYGDDILDYLRQWRDVITPSLSKGIRTTGGLPLKEIIARALQMSDGLHSRCLAASSLLANSLTAPMVAAGVESQALITTINHISNHRLFFLSLAMASAKAMTDWASNIEYSTIVTAMARNGTEFGIRVSGLGDEWFTAPAPKAFLKSFVPYGKGVQPWEKGFGLISIPSEKDKSIVRWSEEFAGRDMGDSAITETVGWGATLLANQPGFLPIVGCSPQEAMAFTDNAAKITYSTSSNYAIPVLNFAGSPLGIDITKVISLNILPIIDTGIAHIEPNNPIVGSGLARPPLECFQKAMQRFNEKYKNI